MSPARSGRNAPSIRDVARLAGVSHMTVSRVLNDAANVSAGTHERVMAAIEELNFRPSHTARALARGHRRMIGVLDTTGGLLYGPASTINAIDLAARLVDYSVTIAAVDPAAPESVRDAVTHLVDHGASGLIIIGPAVRAREVIAEVAPDMPLVTMHGAHEAARFDEQTDAARTAVRHLVDLGHTRLVHIAGPADWSEATARRRGFEAELAASGLTPVAIETSDWSAEAGYRAGIRLLAGPAFTAVFCANDHIALGFLHAARDAAVIVPTDVSVIGFDDTPESAHYAPPLTTVRQDFPEIGRRAIASILAAIEHEPAPPAPPLVPQLIVRASTAPAATAMQA